MCRGENTIGLSHGPGRYIEIRDPEIDAEEVMSRIRANIRARQASGCRAPALPDFQVLLAQSANDGALQYHLREAKEAHSRIWVDLSLAPSPVTQVPVVGRIWGLIREQAHRLVLFYLDKLASRQVGFNEHVVGALYQLAAAQEENSSLRKEIAELRQQLTELEN